MERRSECHPMHIKVRYVRLKKGNFTFPLKGKLPIMPHIEFAKKSPPQHEAATGRGWHLIFSIPNLRIGVNDLDRIG